MSEQKLIQLLTEQVELSKQILAELTDPVHLDKSRTT